MMTVDLTPEAVERLANVMSRPYGNPTGAEKADAAVTLRALSARVAELEAERDAIERSFMDASDGYSQEIAAHEAAEAALATARADALREAANRLHQLGYDDVFSTIILALIPQEKPHE